MGTLYVSPVTKVSLVDKTSSYEVPLILNHLSTGHGDAARKQENKEKGNAKPERWDVERIWV